MKRLVLALACVLGWCGAAQAQTTIIKAIDSAAGTTTDVGNATDHAIRVTQASGGPVWTFNWTQLLGAAPSATNPIPARLTDGTTYIDPRSIRVLTSSDVVTVVQGTGSNLHVVVDTAPTTAITAAALPLPSGASTSANQATGNASLASIDTKTPALGQATMANSSPVVVASDQTALPIAPTTTTTSHLFTASGDTFSINVTNLQSVVVRWSGGFVSAGSILFEGTNNQSVQAVRELGTTTVVGSINVTLDPNPSPLYFLNVSGLTTLKLVSTGVWSSAGITVNVDLSTGPSPIGISASATSTLNQGNAGTNAQAWWTRLGDTTNGPVAVKAASTAAAATDPALVVRSIQLPAALGQTTMASSSPVTIASDQSAVPVTLTSTTITGTVTLAANQSINLNQVGGASFALGQQLAAASLPVVLTASQLTTLTPPAAITGFALETGGNLASIKTDVDKIPSQGQALAAASMPVVLTAAQVTTLTPPTTVAVTSAGLTNLDVALSTRTKPADQQHAILDSGTTTVTQATGTNLHTVVDAGTAVFGALVANQSVNHAQIAGVTVSTGNGVPDTGTQRVFSAQRRTYSASTTAKTATAAGTAPFFALCGSASQTVRVQKVILSGTVATAAIYGDVVLKKTSSATSGGTATALTRAPHDSNSAAATATINYYTVLATAGTSVGVVQTQSAVFPLTGTVAAAMAQLSFLDMNRDPVEAIVLRGTAQCLEMSFGTTPTNVPTLAVSATWTEE